MCDPLTVAGIAMSVGSTVANSVAQGQVQRARNEAIGVERQLQKRFDNETFQLNDGAQDRYTGFGDSMAGKQQELGDYLAAQTMSEPGADAALPSSSSNITVREEGRQRADARQRTDENAQNLARLRSFGDVLGDFGRSDARDAGNIAQIGGFKVGSSNVLPFELEEANQKGQGMRLFADLLGGAGSVATSAGLAGGSLPSLFGGGGTTATTARFNPLAATSNKIQDRLVSLPNLYPGGR